MITGKFYFLDKRSDDGALLKFEGRSHARENTEKLMKLVSQSKIFEALCDKLPKIYVEGYFKKLQPAASPNGKCCAAGYHRDQPQRVRSQP